MQGHVNLPDVNSVRNGHTDFSCRLSEQRDEGNIDDWDRWRNNEDEINIHSDGDAEAPEGDRKPVIKKIQ